jgi:hypothetical protein
MASVYANSYFTISAASCENSSQDFVDMDPVHIYHQSEFVAIPGAPGQSVHIRRSFSRIAERHRLRLSQRAWAYQERLLSPRVLEFTSYDVAFDCDYHTIHEETPHHSQNARSTLDHAAKRAVYDASFVDDPSELYNRWLYIVRKYSSREISRQTDRLPALSGITHIMQQRIGDEYIAGLWKRDMVASLLWGRLDISKDTRCVPSAYIAPSWSWASSTGQLGFTNTHESREFSRLSIIDVTVQLSTSNPFGEISSGSLTARGPLRTLLVQDFRILRDHVSYQLCSQLIPSSSLRVCFAFDMPLGHAHDLETIYALQATALLKKD